MENSIRRLAKSTYWQNFFVNAKEMGSLHLFDNENKLTKIQILFLHWLSVYNSLYQDLANGEDYLTEEVIDDEIRADAYLYFRRKKDNKPSKKEDEEDNASNILGIPAIKFKSKSKRKK